MSKDEIRTACLKLARETETTCYTEGKYTLNVEVIKPDRSREDKQVEIPCVAICTKPVAPLYVYGLKVVLSLDGSYGLKLPKEILERYPPDEALDFELHPLSTRPEPERKVVADTLMKALPTGGMGENGNYVALFGKMDSTLAYEEVKKPVFAIDEYEPRLTLILALGPTTLKKNYITETIGATLMHGQYAGNEQYALYSMEWMYSIPLRVQLCAHPTMKISQVIDGALVAGSSDM